MNEDHVQEIVNLMIMGKPVPMDKGFTEGEIAEATARCVGMATPNLTREEIRAQNRRRRRWEKPDKSYN